MRRQSRCPHILYPAQDLSPISSSGSSRPVSPVPVLPALYISYLASFILSAPEPKPDDVHDPDSKKPAVPVKRDDEDPSGLLAVLLSLTTRSRLPNITNVVINTLLLLASIDLALNPIIYPEQDVVFSRVGAVYPDAAKIMVRYPGAENATQEVQLLYREASATAWKDGPYLSLSKEHDWVKVTKLEKLWPNTDYEYTFASSDGVVLQYPKPPIRFQTFPDSRLGAGSRFKFVVSSCITPNFPYKGPLNRLTIEGFDLLAKSFEHPSGIPASPSVTEKLVENLEDALELSENVTNMTTNTTTENESAPVEEEVESTSFVSRVLPKFMLFLGDFIYADVPINFGEDEDSYLRLYRRNYASPSFRKIYEHIPMLHAYDDHEIKNNWGGDGKDLAPYPDASNAFKLYNWCRQLRLSHFPASTISLSPTATPRSSSLTRAATARTSNPLRHSSARSFNSWLAKVNTTATFKFIRDLRALYLVVGPLTAVRDSWGGYEAEKTQILLDLHSVPNVFVLSGDRHEFAAIEFVGPTNGSTLNMESKDVVTRTRTEVVLSEEGPEVQTFEEEVPRERVVKSTIEIDTTDKDRPLLRLETWIDGKVAYEAETVGTPVKGSLLGSALVQVPDTIKNLLEMIGFQKQWF
ncbi:alkaline phosphatase [Ephemerocybe angulata]|uniref:Alkaline phosphatase n=1 Tax=Ephemerocybe angulata TaxID=980116 RepID=A0A8H6II92_9AGAR|nr:alkaline phosphatase [Tulosesus angulatus]